MAVLYAVFPIVFCSGDRKVAKYEMEFVTLFLGREWEKLIPVEEKYEVVEVEMEKY